MDEEILRRALRREPDERATRLDVAAIVGLARDEREVQLRVISGVILAAFAGAWIASAAGMAMPGIGQSLFDGAIALAIGAAEASTIVSAAVSPVAIFVTIAAAAFYASLGAREGQRVGKA